MFVIPLVWYSVLVAGKPSHAIFEFQKCLIDRRGAPTLRICPGRFMVFPAVWMTVASIVAAFDIARSVDADGNAIDIDLGDDDCDGILRCVVFF